MEYPHRVVGRIADGLVGGVRGVGNGLVGAVKGGGAALMNALDKPFEMTVRKQGPHRIVDRLANGAIDAGVNAVDKGIVQSVQIAGEGIMKALDQPLDELGKGGFSLPKLRK